MEKRKAAKGDKVHILKVSMPEEDPESFRTLAILSSATLYELAAAITQSFGFDFDHAFGFYDNLDFWLDSKEAYELFADIGQESKYPGVEETLVSKAFCTPGKEMLFLFDYGNHWNFFTKLVEITDAREGESYPQVISSEGTAPQQYGDGEIDEDDEIYDSED